MSGSSQQLTLKKGAPGDQMWDLLCVQLASYLEGGPLMWMMPLHLRDYQKSDYEMMNDDDADEYEHTITIILSNEPIYSTKSFPHFNFN